MDVRCIPDGTQALDSPRQHVKRRMLSDFCASVHIDSYLAENTTAVL
jgi:hypothetical protein